MQPKQEPGTAGGALSRTALVFWALIVVQAVALPLSRGEFWPFSIFPMFSGAGKDWNRSLVTRSVGGAPAREDSSQPRGAVVPLREIGVDQNDLSATLSTQQTWGQAQLDALLSKFGQVPSDAPVLLHRVRGRLQVDDKGRFEVKVSYHPRFKISRDRIESLP